ncbi:hypothetical protein OQA88_2232 [Cercophora sp. LCS_1]
MAADGRPAQPAYILRGHKASVHAAAFVHGNERLLTGDADGFVVAWDLTIFRPRAVWQAHTNAILGLADWGRDRVITHGRDNKLIVWRLGIDDESGLSTTLPLDPSPVSRPQPWLLHMLEINTMNFCSFSHCPASWDHTESSEILVAVPNTLASEAIDIFHLPRQERRHTVKLGEKNGMVMALSLSYIAKSLTLVAGYENGAAIVAQLSPQTGWTVQYQAKSHSQPILSLDVAPHREFFLTSSADPVIAKHPLPQPAPSRGSPLDAAERTLRPPEETITESQENAGAKTTIAQTSLLSAPLAGNRDVPTSNTPQTTNAGAHEARVTTEPVKVVNTKHSGQQSLRVRSDGRIFATGGWDSKVRVYSTKTLKEVAVLKWHQAGCYAVALAAVCGEQDPAQKLDDKPGAGTAVAASASDVQQRDETSLGMIPKLVELSVRDKRKLQAKAEHWLAAGSKDGKVSLWKVF